MSPDRDLNHLYPPFRDDVKAILREMNRWCETHRPGSGCIVTETFRSVARQQELYAQGRTAPGKKVTNADGVKGKSKHQSGCAADFALSTPTGIHWNDEDFWQYLGHVARAHGCEWGGDWESPVDKPHVQVKASNKAAYIAAAAWKRVVRLA